MIVLLSPAKTLDFDSVLPRKVSPAVPELLDRATQLMTTLRTQSVSKLGRLMGISTKLAELNHARNQQWQARHNPDNAKPCLYAFQGDVYQGLRAETFGAAQIRFCQKHVRILSGLYGILRPLDLIQPYRLEMGTKLKTQFGADLYDFWATAIAGQISLDLKLQKSRFVVNLASNEYSRAAHLKSLDAQVISPVFKDWKESQFKLISFFAKKARGSMTRYIVENQVSSPAGLLGFDLDGYAYNPSLSSETTPTFTRTGA